jgi:methyltransferase-like protein
VILASRPRPKLKPSLLKRVDADTKFNIDYEWWDKSQLDLKTYLYSRLSIGDEANLDTEAEEVDLVHSETGEVRRVDGFQYVVQTYFNQLPEDFVAKTSLVDAVFYVLLANANQPMSVAEIAERVQRSVPVVLKTIGGTTVYQGIRPILD